MPTIRTRLSSNELGAMIMVEDLSRYHSPVSILFSDLRGNKDWDRFRLSEDQVQFFRENGYLKGVRILSDEQVEALRAELDQLMDPAHRGRALFHEYIPTNPTILIEWFFTRWARGG